MKIIVTGASGYLGSQLANFLGKYNDVFALIRSSSSSNRLNKEVVHIKRVGDVSELDSVLRTVEPDIIINTVALYGRRGESFSNLVEANVIYPSQLFELAEDIGVKAFINTGTSLPEELNVYALTKQTFPKLIKHKNSSMQFINIELEHFYGPHDDQSKFISYVIKQCRQEKCLDLTSGEQKRDFIYIDDVLSAYRLIISNLDKFPIYDSIAIGSGEAYKVKDVVKLIANISKSNIRLNFGSVTMRTNELMYSCADIKTLKSLGWKLQHKLQDGLRLTIMEEN